ncbi:MAG: pirin family protein [Burkholderiales bacterium]
MITLRRSDERGHADHGWLNSFHSFSFAGYQDAEHMGFGPLRVINEDRVAPGQGFGAHGHRDMEIISYVLQGALEHKDSMGNGSVLRPGYVQRMSAGTGVRHSEFNPSLKEGVHFLQIWVEPSTVDIKPGYEETIFSDATKRGKLCLIASSDGRDGSVKIHQDARIFATLLDGDEHVQHALASGRRAYVHVVRGQALVNGQALATGDAAKLSDETTVDIRQAKDAEILLFDLP